MKFLIHDIVHQQIRRGQELSLDIRQKSWNEEGNGLGIGRLEASEDRQIEQRSERDGLHKSWLEIDDLDILLLETSDNHRIVKLTSPCVAGY